MSFTISLAKTRREKKEIFRLRYSVYNKEMHLFDSSADHKNKLLKDPEDKTAHFLYAREGKKIVGAIRMHLGCYHPIPSKYIKEYDIKPFFNYIEPEKMVIVSRLTVDAEYRRSTLPLSLIIACYEFCLKKDIELAFCDCAPHLLHLYSRLGWRRYSHKTISDSEFGILIPLCLAMWDYPYYTRIGSVFRFSLKKIKKEVSPPEWTDRMLTEPHQSFIHYMTHEKNWPTYFKLLTEAEKVTIFEGISEKTVKDLMEKGDIIECQRGQKMIKKGTVFRNIFIILDGKVEVCKEKRIIATLSAGEVFGGKEFLEKTDRSADVCVASDFVRAVSIREQELQKFLISHGKSSSRFLHNMSRIAC